MNQLSVPQTTSCRVDLHTRGANSRLKNTNLFRDIARLGSRPNLIVLSRMPLPGDSDTDRQDLLDAACDRGTVDKVCREFNGLLRGKESGYDAYRSGQHGHRASFVARRLQHLWAALLSGSVAKLVESLQPDTTMRPDRNGTWTLLHAIMSTVHILGWSCLTVIKLERSPDRLDVPNVVSDLESRIEDRDSLRWLQIGLTDTGEMNGDSSVEASNPLFAAAVQSRLMRLVHDSKRDLQTTDAIVLRQADQIIVVGATVGVVSEVSKRLANSLRDAGFGTGDAGYCIDLREGIFSHNGFVVDCLNGNARCRLDKFAFTELEMRLRRCLGGQDAGTAALRVLDEWAEHFAPGIESRNTAPTEWDYADATRRQIHQAIVTAGYNTHAIDQHIDEICVRVTAKWFWFGNNLPAFNWIGRTVFEFDYETAMKAAGQQY